jgi:hypothetical protein
MSRRERKERIRKQNARRAAEHKANAADWQMTPEEKREAEAFFEALGPAICAALDAFMGVIGQAMENAAPVEWPEDLGELAGKGGENDGKSSQLPTGL